MYKEIHVAILQSDTTSKSEVTHYSYDQTILSLSKLCPQLCYNLSKKLYLLASWQ